MKNLINQQRAQKLLATMALFPFVVNSLTLGRITTNSLQSEPLDADILLEDIESGYNINQIYVADISADDYWQMGLTYEIYHDDMEFKTFIGKDNKWYIKATTKAPIDTNFVNFMLRIEYPFGEASREYMSVLKRPILAEKKVFDEEVMPDEYYNFELAETQGASTIQRLDAWKNAKNISPVSDGFHDEYAAHEESKQLKSTPVPVASTVKSSITKVEPVAKVAVKPVPETKAITKLDKGIERQIKDAVASEIKKYTEKSTNNAKSSAAKKVFSKPIVQYRAVETKTFITSKGDTLWEIAKSYTSDNNNIHKMVMTIYTNNKQAFINKNINLLKQNSQLKIPSESSLASVDYRLALNFLVKNTKTFTNTGASASTGKFSKRSLASQETAKQLSKLINDNRPRISNPAVLSSPATSKPVIAASKTKPEVMSSALTKPSVGSSSGPSLKIIAEDNSSLTNRLILASEKLIAGNKENTDLKEQVLILQAQIKDIKALLELRKSQEAKAMSVVGDEMMTAESLIESDTDTSKTSYNPFSTVDIPAIQESVDKIKTRSELNDTAVITTGSAMLNNTAANTPIAKTKDSVAASNKLTGYIGAKVDSISKAGENIVGNQSKFMLILMMLFSVGLFSALVVYLYWRRNYRLQAVMPDLSSGRNHVFVDDLQTYGQDEYLDEDLAAKHENVGSKFRDNFDLVKAYIELNDFVTAKKILSEIVRTGNAQQRARAKKILQTMSAA